MTAPTWRYEDRAARQGCPLVAGLDEVGRGCLAGPVVASAVILDRKKPVRDLNDSKLLSPARRTGLARLILERATAVGIGFSSAGEVEQVNVLEATRRAMRRAVEALDPGPDFLLIDALRLSEVDLPQQDLVKGDRRSVSIAAASIVAKVVRDTIMVHYSRSFPEFDFASNKGYGTAAHLRALARVGPCPIHRRTFRGVWDQGSLVFGG